MIGQLTSAPHPGFRLVPSQFPPIGLFDTVVTAADAEAAMELAGWTNDRLIAERLARLPKAHWVYGRPNSSVIMAAFLHVSPAGGRFHKPDLGAWYASLEIPTAIAEVAHHLRREALARRVPSMARTYRTYSAVLTGDDYRDIRGLKAEHPELYRRDSHEASQEYGEAVRLTANSGIIFDSLRHATGANLVGFIPSLIANVTQTDHYEIHVEAEARSIQVRKLSS